MKTTSAHEASTGSSVKPYKIGDKTYFKGDEVTITSDPYEYRGGEWHDAITESGKKVVVASRAHVSRNVLESRERWRRMQADFRKL